MKYSVSHKTHLETRTGSKGSQIEFVLFNAKVYDLLSIVLSLDVKKKNPIYLILLIIAYLTDY